MQLEINFEPVASEDRQPAPTRSTQAIWLPLRTPSELKRNLKAGIRVRRFNENEIPEGHSLSVEEFDRSAWLEAATLTWCSLNRPGQPNHKKQVLFTVSPFTGKLQNQSHFGTTFSSFRGIWCEYHGLPWHVRKHGYVIREKL